MPEFPEDLSRHSLKEIIVLQAENRARQRELRIRASALVNSRLAKQIGPEEYLAKREATKHEASECKRWGDVLSNEICSRPAQPASL